MELRGKEMEDADFRQRTHHVAGIRSKLPDPSPQPTVPRWRRWGGRLHAYIYRFTCLRDEGGGRANAVIADRGRLPPLK